MQAFIIDLLVGLYESISKRVKRKEEEDAARVQETKRSFLERITGRKA